ncbi:MAG: cupin domain-containing protein [Polyangiaceae bacterium]|jgi:putative transcriptional regulator|nr:cupin domain-containing protein [Polyangiaceae bacterium]
MFFHPPSDRLYQFLGGELEASTRAAVDRHLRRCARCRAEAESLRALLSGVALSVPPAAPPPPLRDRLFASVDRLERFAPFVPQVAELLDSPPARTRLLLHALSDAESWASGPLRSMRFYPLNDELGPARSGGAAMFARFEPGFAFPKHRHEGEEAILVFEGPLADDAGGHYGPGAMLRSADGSCHVVSVPEESPEACLCLVANRVGIELV